MPRRVPALETEQFAWATWNGPPVVRGEGVLAEPLQEQAAFVGVLDRGHLESARARTAHEPPPGQVNGSLPCGGRECRRQDGRPRGLAGHRSVGDAGHRPVPGPRPPRHLGDARRPRRPRTCSTRSRWARPLPVTTSWSTAPPGPRSTTRRPTRRRRSRSTPSLPVCWPGRQPSTDCLIVQLSTDYVFDGTARTPYDVDAPQAPRSAYGRTKAAGEEEVRTAAPENHLVVRTAWLYGAHGSCFPRTIARLARERGTRERRRRPGRAAHLDRRRRRARLPPRRQRGAGRHLARDLGGGDLVVRVRPAGGRVGRPVAGRGQRVTTAEYDDQAGDDARAPRPAYSVLGHEKLHAHGIEPIGPWEERWQAAASAVLVVEQPE